MVDHIYIKSVLYIQGGVSYRSNVNFPNFKALRFVSFKIEIIKETLLLPIPDITNNLMP